MLAYLIASLIVALLIAFLEAVTKELRLIVRYVIRDTTLTRPLYGVGMRLFDLTTGDFFNRIYSNYNYYYFPPLSARDFLSH
jgi:hypothetical protein